MTLEDWLKRFRGLTDQPPSEDCEDPRKAEGEKIARAWKQSRV